MPSLFSRSPYPFHLRVWLRPHLDHASCLCLCLCFRASILVSTLGRDCKLVPSASSTDPTRCGNQIAPILHHQPSPRLPSEQTLTAHNSATLSTRETSVTFISSLGLTNRKPSGASLIAVIIRALTATETPASFHSILPTTGAL